MAKYRCAHCGQMHSGPPFNYSTMAPEHYASVPESERGRRCMLNSDQCIVDDEFFFVLGNIEIPVAGSEYPFSWGVWVSLKKENYQRAVRLWNTPGREAEPHYFGWLNTILPYEPSTFNLKTHVHTRKVGVRPFIELEPTDHPLAVEQREGITMERVIEIAGILQHPDYSGKSHG